MSLHPSETLTRRSLLAGAGALAALLVPGCSRSEPRPSEAAKGAFPNPQSARRSALTVYRDPSCGCCEAWARLAQAAGYEAQVLDDPDMAGVKRRLRVPEALASCHTAMVASFVIEGHVPFEAVDRLLRERPQGILGLAVPGMPIGSPGMESPDGRREPFDVVAFDAAGRTSRFA